MTEKNDDTKCAPVERRVMRTFEEVNCIHAFECFNGCRYGIGCFEDDLNNAMGAKPWAECYCMNEYERQIIVG